MKTLAFLILAVGNLIHCQVQEERIAATLHGILEKLEDISNKLKRHEELLHRIPAVQEKLELIENNLQGGHQEIKSFLQDEISGVISLAKIDECSEGSRLCGHFGICENTLFSFTCSCPPGFTWDGSDCTDIDECVQGKMKCSSRATCMNTLGTYSCSCNPSFEGDGITCSCPSGTELNGDICEDIDECAEGKDDCSLNAVCKNTFGSYNCSCNKPFEGDGRTSCEFLCRSPAKYLLELGCIKRVWEEMTFGNMKEFCRREGGRLLQKFHEYHLHDIMKNLDATVLGEWVGIYNGKWTSDESLVPEDLLEKGYRSDPSRRCGFLQWDEFSSSFKVTQRDCSEERLGFCQFRLP
ncbi:nidogen-2-like isoform X1 [Palaemon carinicauda]|uniref:nidogen-2-like isoform X1 n=1 Tax=Palaemon carinicauda TaxID=392227 RepID=UPI0035B64369